MKLAPIATFDVFHHELSWPWVTLSARGTSLAFADSERSFATRLLGGDGTITAGPSFALPSDVSLAHIRGFSVSDHGARLALVAEQDGAGVLVTIEVGQEPRRTPLAALGGPELLPRAAIFDRTGTRLWISAASATETVLLLIETAANVGPTPTCIGTARSAGFGDDQAAYELYLHPQDDAVLLLAACGPEGTFARVAGWSGTAVEPIATALDAGGLPAGFVGFSADCTRVHLVEQDELRTHSWPGLVELSSVELTDDFVSNYSGIRFAEDLLVDGEDAETHDDAVMSFDRAAVRGSLLSPPFPTGMWVGRLGADVLVTVGSKGNPAPGAAVRLAL